MWRSFSSMRSFPGRFSVALALFLSAAASAQADVCVWRNPERTMTKLFPQARDYTTLTIKVTPEHVAAIEQVLGSPLEPSETHEMNFYQIQGDAGEPLGTVMALAGKAEYGAIEVVIGLDPQGTLVGAYIQQSRERATATIKSPTFLGQFVGKQVDDPLIPGRDLVAAPGAEPASAVVAMTIRKMLLFHEVLVQREVVR